MSLVLAHRLEHSRCDDLALDAEILHWLLHLPQFDDPERIVRHMVGFCDNLANAEHLLATLLPGARYSVLKAIDGGRFWVAAVDASDGREAPCTGASASRAKALLAALFRAFAESGDTREFVQADNGNRDGISVAGTVAIVWPTQQERVGA